MSIITLAPIRYHVELAREGHQLAQYAPSCVRFHKTENGWRINVTPVRAQRAGMLSALAHARDVVDYVSWVAEEQLGPGWGVNQYIWDYSGVTEKPLFPMHTDDFDGYRALKVYVYLEDCDYDQGPLIYKGRPIGGPAGTTILFDPSQEHGSERVARGSRYIFRAHMVERAYVLRHLPDQLPWYLKPVSRGMRWMSAGRRSLKSSG